MKNIIFYCSIIVGTGLILSCSGAKLNNLNKISEGCHEKMSCLELFQCSKHLLKKVKYDYRFSDSIASRQLLFCTGQLASEGNKEAHKYLINYFKVKNLNHQQNPDKYQQNPAIFASSIKSPEVIAFSKLRGKEAFELALEYVETCVCKPFIKHSDETFPIEETFTIIDHIISPMISSIGDQKSLEKYFTQMSINRFQESFFKSPLKEQHALQYNALLKAYKEGKIVFKKYGE
jgi:hypothetical protein